MNTPVTAAATGAADVTLHPPRAALALTLGVTGHRQLDPGDAAALGANIEALVKRFAAGVAAAATAHRVFDEECPPVLRLVSPLASGADQIAAQAALAQRCPLTAILPFAPAEYTGDFDDAAKAAFAALLPAAETVRVLPGCRTDSGLAYRRAGEATVAAADIMLAVWDGLPPRGPGGTAEIVDLAVRKGVPVIHLHPGSGEPSIIWAGYGAVAAPLLSVSDAPRRSLNGLEALIDFVLTPPEGDELAQFLAEREQRLRSRPEWPLFLALVGIQRLRRSSLYANSYAEAARSDWARYRDGVAATCGADVSHARLEAAFAWADGLAAHYAHVYRSGIVLNFGGAALAVVLSLLTLVLPAQKLPILLVELLLIGAVIWNTAHGTRRQWHRRWLDYRYLAEQLRPMRSLKLLGGGGGTVRPGHWTDWYAEAIWRGLAPTPTLPGGDALQQLAEHVAAHDLDAQVAYHQAAAKRMHHLDHRLHRLGLVLLATTIVVGLGTVAGLLFAHAAIKPVLPMLQLLSAGLPTIGAAIFGVRGANDFAGIAGRSAETGRKLSTVAAALRSPGLDEAAAGRTMEQAAAVMLADLGEWQSTYRHRKLAIPS